MSDSSDETEGPPEAAPGVASDGDTDLDADPMIQDEPLLPDPGTGLPPRDGAGNPVGADGTPGGVPDEPMPGTLTPERPGVGGHGGLGMTSDGAPDESMPEALTPGHADTPMGSPGGEDIGASPGAPPDAPMSDGPGDVTGPEGTGEESAGIGPEVLVARSAKDRGTRARGGEPPTAG